AVAKIRVDHLDRGFQLVLERDARGAWFLTDPLAYPALGELVTTLLDTLHDCRGEPDDAVDLHAAHLDPPIVVVEVTTGGATSDPWRVEVGGPDADPRRVFARVPAPAAGAHAAANAVLRIPRTLATTLDRNPDDFRDPRATPMAGSEVVALRRTGAA